MREGAGKVLGWGRGGGGVGVERRRDGRALDPQLGSTPRIRI